MHRTLPAMRSLAEDRISLSRLAKTGIHAGNLPYASLSASSGWISSSSDILAATTTFDLNHGEHPLKAAFQSLLSSQHTAVAGTTISSLLKEVTSKGLSHWHCCILDIRKPLILPPKRHQPREEAMATSCESHKDKLRTLYIDRGETLKDIMSCMSELHGFTMRCGDESS